MRLLLLLAPLLALWSCTQRRASDARALTVFCGSASKPAMEEIAAGFRKETGIVAELIFGGSGTLLAQMELAEKGEIYLPGSPDYIAIGERKGQLLPDADRIVSYLVPAIITPAGNPAGIKALEDLTRPGVRVGLGNPETVCLGLYAVELLERNQLLDAVLANVVTFGGSCSKTANLAAMEQIDAILGWRVFHHWNPQRMALVPIAPEKIPRISTIPISIPVHSRDPDLSKRFIDYVLSPAGQAVYQRYGYLTEREQALALAPGASIGGEYSLPVDYLDRVLVMPRGR